MGIFSGSFRVGGRGYGGIEVAVLERGSEAKKIIRYQSGGGGSGDI